MEKVIANTFGHSLQLFMSTIPIEIMYALALTLATHHLLQYLALSEMIISVTQAVQIVTSTSSMETILSGMVLDVVHSTHAVLGILHHGSGKRYLRPPVMTLR